MGDDTKDYSPRAWDEHATVISESMLAAGIVALASYSRDRFNEEEVVAEIFTAMMRHYQGGGLIGSKRP